MKGTSREPGGPVTAKVGEATGRAKEEGDDALHVLQHGNDFGEISWTVVIGLGELGDILVGETGRGFRGLEV